MKLKCHEIIFLVLMKFHRIKFIFCYKKSVLKWHNKLHNLKNMRFMYMYKDEITMRTFFYNLDRKETIKLKDTLNKHTQSALNVQFFLEPHRNFCMYFF